MLATVPAVGSLAQGAGAAPDEGHDHPLADAIASEQVQPEDVLAMARAAVEAYPGDGRGAGGVTAPMLETAEANLDATERILEIDDRSSLPIERAVAAAGVASEHQADVLGLSADARTPAIVHDRPSRALVALAEQTGTPLDEDDRDSLVELDRLPARVADVLTRVVDAHLSAVLAISSSSTHATDAGGSRGELALPLASLLASREAVLDATAELEAALAGTPDAESEGVVAQVPPAFVVNLDHTDDTYNENVTLLVDAGGDDTYRNNAGGSRIGIGCNDPIPEPGTDQPVAELPDRPPRAAAAVDLGGDDEYVSEADCGVNGGGHFGAGLLLDDGGDDTYRAGNRGVNGGARGIGIGVLVDTGGDDLYEAGDDGANGGADSRTFGIEGQGGAGLLVDGGGQDTYTAGAEGINGGGWGVGVDVVGALVDLGGPDLYRGGHFSVNGGGWLGNGFLVDTGGDDRYEAGDDFGTVGVNGGAQLGVGFIYDDAGNDSYVAKAGDGFDGSENGGVIGGVGFLLDGCGDDTYEADGAGANGGVTGGLGGLAVLADGAGDDVYLAHRGFGGTNGGLAAQFGGMAALTDASGNDTYLAESNAGNGAVDRRGIGELPGPPGPGLLFDGSGHDRYRDPRVDCRDCNEVPKGIVGAQIDVGGGMLGAPTGGSS